MEEYLDVLDENGNFTGITKSRTKVHQDGDWHKTVHIWMINDKNEFLFQKRGPNVIYSNMIDAAVGGHLSAGDSSLEGAIREIKEEINLDVTENELIYLTTFKTNMKYREDYINNQFDDIYFLDRKISIDELKYQEEEIQDLMFISAKDFEEILNKEISETVVPREEFELVCEYINSKK